MNTNGKSWKTTLGGISMILGGLGIILGMVTGSVEFKAEVLIGAITGITGGFAMFFAKDADVTGATGVKDNGVVTKAETVK